MMGIKDRQFALLPDLSLEELVPDDHPYRRLEAEIDLSFVRELVAPLYAGGGRPSVDPVVFFEDLRSERQLMRAVADRLSLRWYLGYDLLGTLPDHSTLTRIRERYGLEIFRSFFDRIVEMCFEAGLVRGEELFVDSTTVGANAAKVALVPRFAMRGHLDKLFGEETASDREIASSDAAMPEARSGELRAANAARKDFVSSAGGHGTRSRTPTRRRSATTPSTGRTPTPGNAEGTARMGYKAHYVVDGGKAGVILTALVTKADVKDNQPMLDLIWHTIFRWKLRPHYVTGDSVYGTIPNVKALEQAGIRAYMPVIDYTWGKRTLFRKDDFAYDEERDVYWCPNGQVLRNTGARNEDARKTRNGKESGVGWRRTGRGGCGWSRNTGAGSEDLVGEYLATPGWRSASTVDA